MKTKNTYLAPACTRVHTEPVILSPSTWTLNTAEGEQEESIKIIEGDPEGDIDAKQHHYNAWDGWDESNE